MRNFYYSVGNFNKKYGFCVIARWGVERLKFNPKSAAHFTAPLKVFQKSKSKRTVCRQFGGVFFVGVKQTPKVFAVIIVPLHYVVFEEETIGVGARGENMLIFGV